MALALTLATTPKFAAAEQQVTSSKAVAVEKPVAFQQRATRATVILNVYGMT